MYYIESSVVCYHFGEIRAGYRWISSGSTHGIIISVCPKMGFPWISPKKCSDLWHIWLICFVACFPVLGHWKSSPYIAKPYKHHPLLIFQRSLKVSANFTYSSLAFQPVDQPRSTTDFPGWQPDWPQKKKTDVINENMILLYTVMYCWYLLITFWTMNKNDRASWKQC